MDLDKILYMDDMENMDFGTMENMTVSKIRPLIKAGYVPTREPCQLYTLFKANHCNCFVHAIGFNNKELAQIGFNSCDSYVFGRVSEKVVKGEEFSKENSKKNMFKFIKSLGLKVSADRKEILKNNEWRVALYFDANWADTNEFHWLRQRNDGLWEGKAGFTNQINVYNQVPQNIIVDDLNYVKEHTYIISNPNANSNAKEK